MLFDKKDLNLFNIFASQKSSHDIDPHDPSFHIVDKVLDLINRSKDPKNEALNLQNKINNLRNRYFCSINGVLTPEKFNFDDFVTKIDFNKSDDYKWEKCHKVKFFFSVCIHTCFRKFFSNVEDPLKNLKERGVILEGQLCEKDGSLITVWFKNKKEAQEFLERFERYLRDKKKLMDEAKKY